MIELLHGLVNAHYEGGNVEDIVIYATQRVYAKTVHFDTAFDEFAALDLNNERDRCVVSRDFEVNTEI